MSKNIFDEDLKVVEESSISWTKLFFISLFLGGLGVDRFLVGDKRAGILKLLTGGGLFIWWLIDLFTIASGKFIDSDGKRVSNTTLQRCFSFIAILLFLGLYLFIFIDSQSRSQERQQVKQQVQKVEEQKLQKYNETYGKVIDAFELNSLFKKNRIEMNKACNKSPIQIEGYIEDMGSNAYGNYLDISTKVFEKEANIRVFLEEGSWNDIAISKIKRNDQIVAGGLCYGQTELFGGIKSSIIIGNARILKIGKKYL